MEDVLFLLENMSFWGELVGGTQLERNPVQLLKIIMV